MKESPFPYWRGRFLPLCIKMFVDYCGTERYTVVRMGIKSNIALLKGWVYMDFTPIRNKSKKILSDNRKSIQKEMLGIVGPYLLLTIILWAITVLIYPSDITTKSADLLIKKYLWGFTGGVGETILAVCVIRVLYLRFQIKIPIGSKVLDTLKNRSILLRCVGLGCIEHVCSSTISTLAGLGPFWISKAPTAVFSCLTVIGFLAQVMTTVFMVFIPCFIAQGLSVKESFHEFLTLTKEGGNMISFLLRVMLPIGIVYFLIIFVPTVLLLAVRISASTSYYAFLSVEIVLIMADTITYIFWMLMPYAYLCIIQYIDKNAANAVQIKKKNLQRV